ncbi:MAG: hypothetical protein IKP46_06310 [Bacteroidales bacterium]|nr:hypothetical protein [Bacteroidales bacterium]
MTLFAIILQIALDVFMSDPNLSAGSLCGYHPQDTLVSAAPKGYKPFYISHIARHGSRYISSSGSDCFDVVDTLALYADKGLLSETGLSMLEDLRMLYGISKDHFGALTELGAREHRDICSRMVRHYPEVFTGQRRREITAYSTESPRVIASMEAFLGELAVREPGLEVTTHETSWKKKDPTSQEVCGFYIPREDREDFRHKEKNISIHTKELRKGYDLKGFEKRIFSDPSKIHSPTVKYVARNGFKCFKTGCVTDPETMPGPGKYFTAGELYYLWLSGNLHWARYLRSPGYESPFTKAYGGGILAKIVEDADKALAAGSPEAATFRFSHDSYLLPVMASIPFEGTYLECDEKETAEFFQDYRYVCPACNVQIIFYRKGDKEKGKVLVKFLLNEKETLIHGLKPATGVYYDWAAVKKFWKM